MAQPNTISNGTLADATEVDDNFDYCARGLEPHTLYTGNGLNVSNSINDDTTETTTKTYTTSISSSSVNNYVVVELTQVSRARRDDDANNAYVQLTIESAEGGSTTFTTHYDAVLVQPPNGGNALGSEKIASTIKYVITPTAGQKSNGVDLKITTKVYLSSNSADGDANGSFSLQQLGVYSF